VNHAGEVGALRIYAGQLAVLKHTASAPVIAHMQEQEKHHKETFDRLLVAHQVRPTALMPLWHVAGFALGAFSAMLGEKAAMACTVAVESVIDQHYAEQETPLDRIDPSLATTVRQFRQDEIDHHDIGIAHGAEQMPGYAGFIQMVTLTTKAAIWLSKRV
jgi:ubiquinone biosynthesis monooxygenase Coq7